MKPESIRITREWLKEKSACAEGSRWFKKHFHEGAIIENVIMMITQDNDADDSWVSWLMQKAKYNDLSWLDGLQITGSLYLRGTGITVLPDNLTVGGYLSLSGTGIKTKDVPAHLKEKVIQ